MPDVRIGAVDGAGPEVFGRILAVEIDRRNRIWVLDGQAQELRVFEPDGTHAFSVGRDGDGPGEFRAAVRVDQGPNGRMWVIDPRSNRLSYFTEEGEYLGSAPFPAGFSMTPWPGGFDHDGHYYAVHLPDGPGVQVVRYDAALTPMDTLSRPLDPVERKRWSHMSPDGMSGMSAGVPFQGRFSSKLGRDGVMWGFVSDQYRLFAIDAAGDTVRTITRAFEPVPVTDEDREAARAELAWFEEQGGTIDWSELPTAKPIAHTFFLEDHGGPWVERDPGSDPAGSLYDVFDGRGRYLGEVNIPAVLEPFPSPIVRDGFLYGVTRDELDVQYLVRYRILKE